LAPFSIFGLNISILWIFLQKSVLIRGLHFSGLMARTNQRKPVPMPISIPIPGFIVHRFAFIVFFLGLTGGGRAGMVARDFETLFYCLKGSDPS